MADLKDIPNRDPIADGAGLVSRPWLKWVTDLRLAVNRLIAGIFDGNVTIAGLLTLTSGQITFPATQNPSADPHTLDDYEEGTWMPTLGGTGGESGQVYAQQDGYYVKVGRFVHAACRVQLSTLGTITGAVRIKGLPFTIANLAGYRATGTVAWTNLTTAYTTIVAIGNENSTAVDLVATAAATTSLTTQVLAQGDLTATTRFNVGITYEASV